MILKIKSTKFFSIISLLVLFFCANFSVVLDTNAQTLPPLHDEIKAESFPPGFKEKYSVPQNENNINHSILNTKKVRIVYLIPADKVYREEYKVAIIDAALHLQDFFQKEIGEGVTFDFSFEVHQTEHPASWYSTNNIGGNQAFWYVFNTLADGFTETGGFIGDNENRWVFFNDANLGCGQNGGARGVPPDNWAVLHANDLRGLTRQGYIPPCSGGPNFAAGIHRWIGGLGHEVGHTWDLPHPPGCDKGSCIGGQNAQLSLMFQGAFNYPFTYLLSADRQHLLNDQIAAPFFTPTDLRSPISGDFENDRKADISIWRPSNGGWYVLPSSGGSNVIAWGQSGDKPVPGDYDGDGKTDRAVWRPDTGVWYIFRSSDDTISALRYGLSEDIPVPADFDGDTITDIAVWRPSNGVWYVFRSASDTNYAFAFGASGDLPVAGDYNGDKRADIAVFRPSERNWYIYNYYSNSFQVSTFGLQGDKLVPGDFDGDSKSDIAVWRPGNGVWYLLTSRNGFQAIEWGQNGDVPIPADYDGDGKTDIAVWRPSTAVFYIINSSTNSVSGGVFGQENDISITSAFVR